MSEQSCVEPRSVRKIKSLLCFPFRKFFFFGRSSVERMRERKRFSLDTLCQITPLETSYRTTRRGAAQRSVPRRIASLRAAPLRCSLHFVPDRFEYFFVELRNFAPGSLRRAADSIREWIKVGGRLFEAQQTFESIRNIIQITALYSGGACLVVCQPVVDSLRRRGVVFKLSFMRSIHQCCSERCCAAPSRQE